METKHTPGPWNAVELSYNSSAYYIYGSGKDKRSLAVAHIPRSTIQPMEANARLIAAAPDLLAALKLLLVCVDDEGRQREEPFVSVRAAIAKATGAN